jgi:hypothetical protein
VLTTSSQSFLEPDPRGAYAPDMQLDESADARAYRVTPAPPLPHSITSFCGSVKRSGRFSVPPELHLTAAFAELKLDLREALFPDKHVLLVADSLCSSVEVRLPEGVTVVDHGVAMFSSHKLSPDAAEEHGPIIHLDGWSLFSDVKFVSDSD